ncbi:MAG: hypothetical protein SNI72_05500 [Rikenellaceae bacterium]
MKKSGKVQKKTLLQVALYREAENTRVFRKYIVECGCIFVLPTLGREVMVGVRFFIILSFIILSFGLIINH